MENYVAMQRDLIQNSPSQNTLPGIKKMLANSSSVHEQSEEKLALFGGPYGSIKVSKNFTFWLDSYLQ